MPSNAQVSSATLELYAMRYAGGSTTGDYTVYKLSRSWVEAEANWTNASAMSAPMWHARRAHGLMEPYGYGTTCFRQLLIM
ncbi:MAG: hypothetical protein JXA71_10065 [Chitinispirillaceae bacterium]|nr:hypothetical protein [Chitinispirillaceae bacterium]